MYCQFNIVRKTQNGILIQCDKMKNFQLTFNNLNFHLTPIELNSLRKYLQNIDIEYWEKEYENSIYDKKIPIPTLQTNFIILLDKFEVFELIHLLNFKEEDYYLDTAKIKYPLNYN